MPKVNRNDGWKADEIVQYVLNDPLKYYLREIYSHPTKALAVPCRKVCKVPECKRYRLDNTHSTEYTHILFTRAAGEWYYFVADNREDPNDVWRTYIRDVNGATEKKMRRIIKFLTRR